jgi:hypothetical protein
VHLAEEERQTHDQLSMPAIPVRRNAGVRASWIARAISLKVLADEGTQSKYQGLK